MTKKDFKVLPDGDIDYQVECPECRALIKKSWSTRQEMFNKLQEAEKKIHDIEEETLSAFFDCSGSTNMVVDWIYDARIKQLKREVTKWEAEYFKAMNHDEKITAKCMECQYDR